MKSCICLLSIIPVRATHSEQSEMVTQLLFGETFSIIEEQKEWSKIKITYDNYEGWVDNKQITMLTPEASSKINANSYNKMTDLIGLVHDNENKIVFPILLGCNIPILNDKCIYDSFSFTFDGNSENIIFDKKDIDTTKIIDNAFLYLNAPYLWGGRTTFGIDCSGFTQMAFKLSGLKINRDASQQAKQGKKVNTVKDALPGDLAFFSNSNNKITHVGIIFKENKIIHSSGKVRIDILNEKGIMKEDGSYSHKLNCIRRIT